MSCNRTKSFGALIGAVLIITSCGPNAMDTRGDHSKSFVGERKSDFDFQGLQLVNSTLFNNIFPKASTLSSTGIPWTGATMFPTMSGAGGEFARLETIAQGHGVKFIQGRADWLSYRSSISSTTFIANATCNAIKANALAHAKTIADGYYLARVDVSSALGAANSCVAGLSGSCGPAPLPDVPVGIARIGLSATAPTTLPAIYLRSNSSSCRKSLDSCGFYNLPFRPWLTGDNSIAKTINGRFKNSGFQTALTGISTEHMSLSMRKTTMNPMGCLP